MKYLGLGLNFPPGFSLVLMHKFYTAANSLCGHVKFSSHVGVSVSIGDVLFTIVKLLL